MEQMNDVQTAWAEEQYMNNMQLRANLIDPNVLIAEIARAGGKTQGVMGPRIIRVGYAMPQEISFFVHKTYAALLTNVWPAVQSYFSTSTVVAGVERPMMREGIEYVAGTAKLPKHFKLPRKPISYPKHSIVLNSGHVFQLVASDQPESVAGASGVHAFVEEMKHNKGEKLKSRLFPSLRGSSAQIRKCPLYQGITGVSDTARVDLGEDNWFEDYENNVNSQLIDEIATVSMHYNRAMYELYEMRAKQKVNKDVLVAEAMRLDIERKERILKLWGPRLNDMRKNATYYMRASSFVNKDVLGAKFFKTQFESMTVDEFMVAICAIRCRAVANRFFATYDPKKHQFSDGYKYNALLSLDLSSSIDMTSQYLKYYNPHNELLIGYDPGHFSSMVVSQESDYGRTCRTIKEFFACHPEDQTTLARNFAKFFCNAANKTIKLYHDRAGNKRKEEYDQITTDAKLLQKELESYGFHVQLMSEGDATVYHWQQFKMVNYAFSDNSNALPQFLIDENECPNLCSAIMITPVIEKMGKIELDKSSEKRIPLRKQAGLTTQLPSAYIYFLHGRYANKLPKEFSQIPVNLPDNSYV